jgi:hypothetical protein
MATNYVLVDFENVQPDMSGLAGAGHKVVVFFGAKQQASRHHFEKFDSLFALGADLERVKVPSVGNNALDMHIAFYIGRIFEKERNATVHVISRDTDFDPLIEYLSKSEGVKISRSKDVGALAKQRPMPATTAMGAVPRKSKGPVGGARKPQAQKTPPQKPPQAQKAQPQKAAPQPQKMAQQEKKPQRDPLDQFIKQLKSMSGKPSTRKKLAQTLAAYFKHHGGEQPANVVEQTIEDLVRRGVVAQAGTKVTYSL